MVTFTAGLVRRLDASGIATHCSCDGHGDRTPRIDLSGGDTYLLDASLSLASQGARWSGREGLRARGRAANRHERLEMAERSHDLRTELLPGVAASRPSEDTESA
jgi:hypothetical protein